ncbi:MAG: pantoate--beta-alanine ligase [Actinomycetota bacterium]|nr:pantoate--beta-alanine ligase [Actinomycetota bacterium]
MRLVTGVPELRGELLDARRQGRIIGLVPTMGALHDGHLSLIRRAREQCDVVVVSLFVNPAQFNDASDLAAYPRDTERDARLAAGEGVDILFAPSETEVYPSGFATRISVATITENLEGVSRGRAHFDGVTTLVAKLLNMVGPEVAYFGQKDAQQAAVIRRLVRDLNLPVRIEVCPTVRDSDGLALSSRNALLSPSERDRGTALHRALWAISQAVQAGERDPAAARAAGLAELERSGVTPEYLEMVTPDTLERVERIEDDVLAVIAAPVGPTRLIDNILIQLAPTPADGVGASHQRSGLNAQTA